jgi:hypothetical protein
LCGESATPYVLFNTDVTGGSTCGTSVSPDVTYECSVTGGATCGSSALVYALLTIIGEAGAICGGNATQANTIPETSIGGITCSGSVNPLLVFNPLISPYGILIGGGISQLVHEIGHGGVVCGGTVGDLVNVPITAAGVKLGGAVIISVERLTSIKCKRNEYKCGTDLSNETCLEFVLVQGYGSKIFKYRRRSNSLCLDPDNACYDGDAYVAPITFCRQNFVRPIFENQGEAQSETIDPPATNLMKTVGFAVENEDVVKKSILEAPKIKKSNIRNTPQMAKLKKERIQKKPKPVTETSQGFDRPREKRPDSEVKKPNKTLTAL